MVAPLTVALRSIIRLLIPVVYMETYFFFSFSCVLKLFQLSRHFLSVCSFPIILLPVMFFLINQILLCLTDSVWGNWAVCCVLHISYLGNYKSHKRLISTCAVSRKTKQGHNTILVALSKLMGEWFNSHQVNSAWESFLSLFLFNCWVYEIICAGP